MKLIHLTDTHFVPKGETLYGRDPRVALEAAVADINRHHGDADLVVITGDLTHWGEPEAFENLREVLDQLQPPLRLLIGNHDTREVFAEFFPGQPRDPMGFVQSVLHMPAGHMIFMDTNLEGTHAGWFCADRRAWLDARLTEAAAADQDVFLFMHHPPFATGLPTLDRISLQEPEKLAEVLRPHLGSLRHLFFGHVHRPISGSWMGIPFSTLRAMNHQCELDFTGTSDIAGCFEPPAYAVVLFRDETLLVHSHDFMDKSERFSLHDSPVADWAVKYAHP